MDPEPGVGSATGGIGDKYKTRFYVGPPLCSSKFSKDWLRSRSPRCLGPPRYSPGTDSRPVPKDVGRLFPPGLIPGMRRGPRISPEKEKILTVTDSGEGPEVEMAGGAVYYFVGMGRVVGAAPPARPKQSGELYDTLRIFAPVENSKAGSRSMC